MTLPVPARILVVGGGGREHALAWKLSREPGVGDVVVASMPPVQLGPITQGGVVGVGDTNTCDFDDFRILSRDG